MGAHVKIAVIGIASVAVVGAMSAVTFFLLRPDGHIGLCGGVVDAAAVRRYFAENLALLDGERHRPIAGGNRPTAPVASVVTGGAC